ncbi:MAG: hypothetical protein B1H04_01595 [Planctomycetales bacterium 4484_123]|nr:MAG: hypothetical protein B1H04_01595 [Planctomycetales bacterium 4484_123]
MSRTIVLAGLSLTLGLWALQAEASDKPPGARELRDRRGELVGWAPGPEFNPITIIPADLDKRRPGRPWSPTAITRDFRRRSVTGPGQWQAVRQDIKGRIRRFLGEMPDRKLPLGAKVERQSDRGDYTTALVSLAFSKTERAELCLVVPKGVPAGAVTVIMYGAFGNGMKSSPRASVRGPTPSTSPGWG